MNMKIVKNFSLTIILSGLFAMNTNGQNPIKNYDAEWKKVEAFSKKGLPKSAMEELKKIYILAKKEGQDAQVIKTMSYGISLQNETREDNENISISEVEKG